MKKFKVISLIFLFACDALTGRERVEEMLVKDTVKRYLQSLSVAYRYFRLEDIRKCSTKEEANKVEALAGLWKMKGEAMESEILEVNFSEVKIEKNGVARVQTREKWRYRYIKPDTGEEVKRWVEEHYWMSYELVKENNLWLVNKTSIISRD